MARFGMKIKRRRKAGIGGFHAEYLNDKTAIRHRKQMGMLRSLFTGLSLLFGGAMIYVAMHYVPAYVKPQKVLKLASGEIEKPKQGALSERSVFGKYIGPYVDMFSMERSFLQAGQTVDVKYALPKGSTMDVKIRQCRRLWIVEVFTCQIVNEQVVRVDGSRGTQRFTLSDGGFYHFDERVNLSDESADYRVIWKRS
jgi:hypothetical protein